MDKAALIHTRKGRCMAQVLEEFEKEIEPRIPTDVAKPFKAFVRSKIAALAVDSIDVMNLEPGTEINGHAQAMRDSLHSGPAIGTTKGASTR